MNKPRYCCFLQLIAKRSSVRKFDSKQVEKEKLLTILEAGRLAPTATNRQPYKILVLETPDGIAKLRKNNKFIYEAPLALIVCANHKESFKRNFPGCHDGKDSGDTDTSIVTDHMMLCAADLDLGSVWIWAFDPVKVRADFNILEQYEPVHILLIGYPAADAGSWSWFQHGKMRKPLEESVVYETF